MPRKIYVASSWRNTIQPLVVMALMKDGHQVYDFKHPFHGDNGFHWSDIDPGWQSWTNKEYLKALEHEIAVKGFSSDFNAMQWADTCVTVLPCGRSAHLEAGWFIGQGKPAGLLLSSAMEPELMPKMFDYIDDKLSGILDWVNSL